MDQEPPPRVLAGKPYVPSKPPRPPKRYGSDPGTSIPYDGASVPLLIRTNDDDQHQKIAGDQAPEISPLCRTCALSFAAFIIVLGVAILVLVIEFRPKKMHVAVESATLSPFVLNAAGGPPTSFYNLSIVAGIHNPNRKFGIHYDFLEAEASYKGNTFSQAELQLPAGDDFQGHNTTLYLQAVMPASSGTTSFFGDDEGIGYVAVDVHISALVRYMFRPVVKGRKHLLKYRCSLLLLPSAGEERAPPFTRTPCVALDRVD